MERLKPCPFCGKDAIAFSELESWDCRGNNVWRAYCGCCNNDCGIGAEMFHDGDDLCDERDEDEETCSGLMDLAIEKWNKRAEECGREKLIELADEMKRCMYLSAKVCHDTHKEWADRILKSLGVVK